MGGRLRLVAAALALLIGGASADPLPVPPERMGIRYTATVRPMEPGARPVQFEGAISGSGQTLARRTEGATSFVVLYDRPGRRAIHWDDGGPGFYPQYFDIGVSGEMRDLMPLLNMDRALEAWHLAAESGPEYEARVQPSGEGPELELRQVDPSLPHLEQQTPTLLVDLDENGRIVGLDALTEFPDGGMWLLAEETFEWAADSGSLAPRSVETVLYDVRAEVKNVPDRRRVVDLQGVRLLGDGEFQQLVAAWTSGLVEQSAGLREVRGDAAHNRLVQKVLAESSGALGSQGAWGGGLSHPWLAAIIAAGLALLLVAAKVLRRRAQASR